MKTLRVAGVHGVVINTTNITRSARDLPPSHKDTKFAHQERNGNIKQPAFIYPLLGVFVPSWQKKQQSEPSVGPLVRFLTVQGDYNLYMNLSPQFSRVHYRWIDLIVCLPFVLVPIVLQLPYR